MKKQETECIKIQHKEIPIFFAADENYLPFLSVTIASMKAHANRSRLYQIHVLCEGVSPEKENLVKQAEEEYLKITFHDVSEKRKEIERFMYCRDYYTSAIYFRLFIPQLFPQYDKAVYLDCDVVLLQDVANLYDCDLGEGVLGAVADSVVASISAFRDYTKNALGIAYNEYFNSGVLVMDLQKMREMDFCRLFSKVLSSYDFIVAPDQDCLNLICKGKVCYLPKKWNTMPVVTGKRTQKPALVHYNLSMKPWHYDGVLYGEYFWEFAAQTPFLSTIEQKKQSYGEDKKLRDKEQGEKLIALAKAEADSPCNYLHSLQREKRQKEMGRYAFNQEKAGKFAKRTSL